MQAIQTRYLAPTNHRSSRIRAWCMAGSTVIPFPYDCDTNEAHLRAAYKLAHELGWTEEPYGKLVQGTLPNGEYCHTFVKGNTPRALVKAFDAEYE